MKCATRKFYQVIFPTVALRSVKAKKPSNSKVFPRVFETLVGPR